MTPVPGDRVMLAAETRFVRSALEVICKLPFAPKIGTNWTWKPKLYVVTYGTLRSPAPPGAPGNSSDPQPAIKTTVASAVRHKVPTGAREARDPLERLALVAALPQAVVR